jgi:leucyl-tRNA synthetase
MSKSKRNVVAPEPLVERYGADGVRLFYLFAAPVERDLEWSDQGVEGAFRFLTRVWRLVYVNREHIANVESVPPLESLSGRALGLHRHTHRAIRKASQDIGERFHFNTAIAATMELVNAISKFTEDQGFEEPAGAGVLREALRSVVLLLAPVVPHMTAELWEAMGYTSALEREPWPQADPRALVEDTVVIVVQVNGKLRARLSVSRGTDEPVVLEKALAEDAVRRHLDGRAPRKHVYVPDRLLNLVV